LESELALEQVGVFQVTDDEPYRIQGSERILVEQTAWLDKFFHNFSAKDSTELLRAVDGLRIDLGRVQALDDYKLSMSGWLYWLLFLQGYGEFRRLETLSPSNTYLRYLQVLFDHHRHDPGLARDMDSESRLSSRVLARYDSLHRFLSPTEQEPEPEPEPVIVVVRFPASRGGHVLRLAGSDDVLEASMIDGYHRLFNARLAGWPTYPCILIRENASLPVLNGEVTEYLKDGRRVRVSGWIRVDKAVRYVELRDGGTTICIATPERRLMQGEAPSYWFVLESQLSRPLKPHGRLLVVPQSAFMRPIGCLAVPDRDDHD